MKIEPGYWRTREGVKVQVLAVDVQGIEANYTVVGVIRGLVRTWTADGHYYCRTSTDSCDLLEPWHDPATEERVVWLVRWPNGETSAFDTAADGHKPDAVNAAIIGSTRVTVTEGVFA
jgi:hypothetical protein